MLIAEKSRQNAPAGKSNGAGIAFGEPLFVEGALDGECVQACGEQQGQRADAVEIAVVAFFAKPVEKLSGVSLRGDGPKFFLPACGCFEQCGRDLERVVKAGSEMAAVDADNDPQFIARRIFFEEGRESATQPMKFVEVVPHGKAFDVGVKSAAKQRDEADGPFASLGFGMKLMKRLEPEERKFDGVLALVRLRREMLRGCSFSDEIIDQIGGAEGAAERGGIIAAVEIPFQT